MHYEVWCNASSWCRYGCVILYVLEYFALVMELLYLTALAVIMMAGLFSFSISIRCVLVIKRRCIVSTMYVCPCPHVQFAVGHRVSFPDLFADPAIPGPRRLRPRDGQQDDLLHAASPCGRDEHRTGTSALCICVSHILYVFLCSAWRTRWTWCWVRRWVTPSVSRTSPTGPPCSSEASSTPLSSL